MPTTTFLYAIHNRADLFRNTLEKFAEHENGGFRWEIFVVDDRSDDDLWLMLADFDEKLPIRVVKINPRRAYPNCYVIHDAINPSYAQNVGLRKARGEKIVFSSPEIMPTSPNWVEFLAKQPFSEKTCLIGDCSDPTYGVLCGGAEKRRLPFLAAFTTSVLRDIGGVEEDFMEGFAFEDNNLEWRWLWAGCEYEFSGPAWSGWHQPHPRFEGEARTGWAINRARWMTQYESGLHDPIANRNRTWGSAYGIEEAWFSHAWHQIWS